MTDSDLARWEREGLRLLRGAHTQMVSTADRLAGEIVTISDRLDLPDANKQAMIGKRREEARVAHDRLRADIATAADEGRAVLRRARRQETGASLEEARTQAATRRWLPVLRESTKGGGSVIQAAERLFADAVADGDEATTRMLRRELPAMAQRYGEEVDPDLSRRLDLATGHPEIVKAVTIEAGLDKGIAWLQLAHGLFDMELRGEIPAEVTADYAGQTIRRGGGGRDPHRRDTEGSGESEGDA